MMRQWLAVSILCLALPVHAGDVEDLTALLENFLGDVDSRATHDRFWAEDLVYTSSAGLRFGKDQIMAGFDEPGDTYTSTYGAKDVDIRVYDDMAIVAFRLVGAAPDGETSEYFNTGTFALRDGEWRAVAWQATRIPPDDAATD